MEITKTIPPQQEEFASGMWISLSLHLSILSFVVLQKFLVPEIEPQLPPSVRVDIVGLPDKVQTLTPKTETAPDKNKPTEEVKKEVIPSATVKPVSKQNKEEIKLTKDKQKDALNKLKTLSALDKIKNDLKQENEKKRLEELLKKTSAQGNNKIKGNILASGTELTGVDRLQHEDYRNLLDRHIKPLWQAPEWLAKKGYRAVAVVRIDPRGQMISRQIVKTSGNPEFDSHVLETIERSAPYPAPPEKFMQIASIEGILIYFGNEGATR